MAEVSDPVFAGMAVFLVVFVSITVLGYFLSFPAAGDQRRASHRLRELAAGLATVPETGKTPSWVLSALPKLGALGGFDRKAQMADLRASLLHAGYFRPNAPLIFMGVRVLLTLVLTLAGVLIPYWANRATWRTLGIGSLAGTAAGMLVPRLWLTAQVRKRQRSLRNALPDTLDLLVLCLEGGVNLNAAIQRVTDELQVVHPVLAVEMNIIEREIQLGLSPGQTFRKFGDRCGLSDVSDLASVLLQSERYGASVAKVLRSYADAARLERQQRVQEMAQKAAVKILFPTLLCIFPAIFIVLLGPAAFQLAKLFSR